MHDMIIEELMACISDEDVIESFNIRARKTKKQYNDTYTNHQHIMMATNKDINKPITSKIINKSCLKPIIFGEIIEGVNRGKYLKVNIVASLSIVGGISTIIRDTKGLLYNNLKYYMFYIILSFSIYRFNWYHITK
jgi:hypothetical protein